MRVDLSIYFSPTVKDFSKQFCLLERDFHCASFDISFVYVYFVSLKKKRLSLKKVKVSERHRLSTLVHISRKSLWKKIEELGWEVLSHPPYSPDLAPSDYHLFRSMQHSLAERKFTNREKVQLWVSNYFESQPAEFYKRGIHSLRKC